MKFELDFNKETDFYNLELLADEIESFREFFRYNITLNTFEDLEKLLEKVKQIKGDYYSAVISYNPPIIYLDKEV